MKSILFLILGVLSMAEEISIPYPHPAYDDNLLAKEIINGTYIASINMMIKNSQTGEERYVYVPDSPDIIKDMERGNEPDATDVNNVSDDPIVYDRNKSLEDAVLPVKVELGREKPMIVSTAMCPQNVEFIGTVDVSNEISTYRKNVSRYDDGINKFLVIFEKTDDGSSSENTSGDVYAFYKFSGVDKVKLFDVNVDDFGTPLFVYSINKRNFFYAGNKIYEYSEDGFTKILQVGIYEVVPFMISDGDNVYIVGMHGTISLQDVDNGNIATSDFSASSASRGNKKSAYDDAYFMTNSNTYYVDRGEIKEIQGLDYFASDAKIRFDYIRDGKVLHYNEKHNLHDYPKASTPASKICYLGDAKEAYFSIGPSGEIYYSKNYISYKSTDIIQKGTSFLYNYSYAIANFSDYVYTMSKTKLNVFKINKWGYPIPRSDLGELFAKHNMIDRGYPVIGD